MTVDPALVERLEEWAVSLDVQRKRQLREFAQHGWLYTDDVQEQSILLREAIAALSSPPDQWRSIETAPRDTAVLTYGFGYEVAHFNTHPAINRWVSCWDHRAIATPSVWMPLPEPPPADGAGEDA